MHGQIFSPVLPPVCCMPDSSMYHTAKAGPVGLHPGGQDVAVSQPRYQHSRREHYVEEAKNGSNSDEYALYITGFTYSLIFGLQGIVCISAGIAVAAAEHPGGVAAGLLITVGVLALILSVVFCVCTKHYHKEYRKRIRIHNGAVSNNIRNHRPREPPRPLEAYPNSIYDVPAMPEQYVNQPMQPQWQEEPALAPYDNRYQNLPPQR